MDLHEYINTYHEGKSNWFQEETSSVYHSQRVNQILDIKSYIEGNHKILDRNTEIYNGKTYTPKAVIMDYMNLIIQFHAQYLLRNPVTITSSTEDVTKKIKDVYENGFYDDVDYRILESLIKFGNCYEYCFIGNDKTIKSKLIPVEDSYPIYSPVTGEMTGFIEHYTIDNISYWNIYDNSKVVRYTDKGGNLHFIGEYNSLAGLPIPYKTNNELDGNFGTSEILRAIPLIDELEFNLSKFSDTAYKFHDPLFMIYGTQNFNTEKYSPHLVGKGMAFDYETRAEFLSPKLDHQSFKAIMDTTKQSLLDIMGIPSVAVNSAQISNVSSTAIKLMYEVAEVFAGVHAKYLKRGIKERFNKFRQLLKYQGVELDNQGFNDLNVIFRTSKPSNEQELITNMKTLREVSGISQITILENSPFTTDTDLEQKRIANE